MELYTDSFIQIALYKDDFTDSSQPFMDALTGIINVKYFAS